MGQADSIGLTVRRKGGSSFTRALLVETPQPWMSCWAHSLQKRAKSEFEAPVLGEVSFAAPPLRIIGDLVLPKQALHAARHENPSLIRSPSPFSASTGTMYPRSTPSSVLIVWPWPAK